MKGIRWIGAVLGCLFLSACQMDSPRPSAVLTVEKKPAQEATLLTRFQNPLTCDAVVPRSVDDQLQAKPLHLPGTQLVTVRVMQLNPYGKRFVSALSWVPKKDAVYRLDTSFKKEKDQVVFSYQLKIKRPDKWRSVPYIARDFHYTQHFLTLKQGCPNPSTDLVEQLRHKKKSEPRQFKQAIGKAHTQVLLTQ